MKTLSIASQYDRLPKATSGQRELKSVKALTPACEGIFDFIKRSKVEKEVQADPTRVSTANKSIGQMLLTIKHFVENPDAYTFHGEKVTVNTNIFGFSGPNGSISSLISELEKFAKTFPGEIAKLAKQRDAEHKPRKKHCDNLQAEFNKVRSEGPNVGEAFVRKHIYPIASQFIPTGPTLLAEGKLSITTCHVPLFTTKLVSFDWGKDGRYEITESCRENSEIVVPALSPTDGERLIKLLWSLAGKTKISKAPGSSDLTYPKMEEAEELEECDDGFYYDKGMVRSCETDDAACLVTQVWGDGIGSSSGDLIDMFNQHIFSVFRTWTIIALSSLKRNPNVALEEYYEHTPACEGFVDIIRDGLKKLMDRGDKREKHKLVVNSYGGSAFNPKQQGKRLRDIVKEALADTYDDPKWVEKNVDNTSSMYEHAEMGYLYAGKSLVKLENLVGEFKKTRGFLDDIRRREQPFIDIRRTVLEKVHEIAKIGGSEQRIKLAVELYDRYQDKLESFVGSRISTSVAKYNAVGCQGSLFAYNPPRYNNYYPVKGKTFEYPIPSKENYKTYIEVLNALITESEDFETWWKEARKEVSVSYFEFLPEFIWDDMETGESVYYDKYISNVTYTQSRDELANFYWDYASHLIEAIIAVYHLLFNAQKLNPANEGLVDFMKDLFDTDKRAVNKIFSGKKDVVAEVTKLLETTYNNPNWVAKLPEGNAVQKGSDFSYLVLDNHLTFEGDLIIKNATNLTKEITNGCRRLSGLNKERVRIISELDSRDEDTSLQNAFANHARDVVKIAAQVKGYFKPMSVIGGGKWFTPAGTYLLNVAPVKFEGAEVPGMNKTLVVGVRKDIINVVTTLTNCIAELHGFSVGDDVGSHGNEIDEGVYLDADDQLSGEARELVMSVLFNGDEENPVKVGTASSIAHAAAVHLSKVLESYISWVFNRKAGKSSLSEVDQFKASIERRQSVPRDN